MRNHNGRGKPDRSQGPVQLEHIEAIEKSLWNAADTLRSNSNYASNEYFMPVMGLIDRMDPLQDTWIVRTTSTKWRALLQAPGFRREWSL